MQPLALAQAEELPALVLAPGGDEREQLLLRVVDDEEQPAHLCFLVVPARSACGIYCCALQQWVAPRELALRRPDSELSQIRASQGKH